MVILSDCLTLCVVIISDTLWYAQNIPNLTNLSQAALPRILFVYHQRETWNGGGHIIPWHKLPNTTKLLIVNQYYITKCRAECWRLSWLIRIYCRGECCYLKTLAYLSVTFNHSHQNIVRTNARRSEPMSFLLLSSLRWISHVTRNLRICCFTMLGGFHIWRPQNCWIFLPPLSCRVQKSADFVPFPCFLGTPSPLECGHHLWKPPYMLQGFLLHRNDIWNTKLAPFEGQLSISMTTGHCATFSIPNSVVLIHRHFWSLSRPSLLMAEHAELINMHWTRQQ